jgi:hypothetical protein
LISAFDSLVEKQKNRPKEEVCDNPIFDAISDELLATLDFPELSAPSFQMQKGEPVVMLLHLYLITVCLTVTNFGWVIDFV